MHLNQQNVVTFSLISSNIIRKKQITFIQVIIIHLNTYITSGYVPQSILFNLLIIGRLMLNTWTSKIYQMQRRNGCQQTNQKHEDTHLNDLNQFLRCEEKMFTMMFGIDNLQKNCKNKIYSGMIDELKFLVNDDISVKNHKINQSIS